MANFEDRVKSIVEEMIHPFRTEFEKLKADVLADINAAKEAAIEDITKAAEAARVIPQQREG